MHVIAKSTLRAFWEKHTDSKSVLEIWHKIASDENWEQPQDVSKSFARCSFLGDNRVVFRLKGNEYRLVAVVDYKFKKVFIRFVGTHAEYDKIDANTI